MTILTSIQCPEDAVNAALIRIGYPIKVNQMAEGSRAAIAARQIFGQTRDDLLRKGNFGFSRRDATLQLLKVSPCPGYSPIAPWNPVLNPPLPWKFQYAYPTDCLIIRSLRSAPFLLPVMSPRAVRWSVSDDDTVTPDTKVILSDLVNAICTYTARVTTPAVWESSFCETFIDALAKSLAPALTKPEEQQIEGATEIRQANMAVHLEG